MASNARPRAGDCCGSAPDIHGNGYSLWTIFYLEFMELSQAEAYLEALEVLGCR